MCLCICVYEAHNSYSIHQYSACIRWFNSGKRIHTLTTNIEYAWKLHMGMRIMVALSLNDENDNSRAMRARENYGKKVAPIFNVNCTIAQLFYWFISRNLLIVFISSIQQHWRLNAKPRIPFYFLVLSSRVVLLRHDNVFQPTEIQFFEAPPIASSMPSLSIWKIHSMFIHHSQTPCSLRGHREEIIRQIYSDRPRARVHEKVNTRCTESCA